jgi:hypothetical protein
MIIVISDIAIVIGLISRDISEVAIVIGQMSIDISELAVVISLITIVVNPLRSIKREKQQYMNEIIINPAFIISRIYPIRIRV